MLKSSYCIRKLNELDINYIIPTEAQRLYLSHVSSLKKSYERELQKASIRKEPESIEIRTPYTPRWLK